jgi:sn-glycerol 3-phosphate transport system ATP-binding protein/multiple sugar transport system ATP-binding protein
MHFSKNVRLEGIRKKYGNLIAINHVDLAIDAGERVVLLGPSGSGKTTLLKIIAGLEHPSSGNIFFNGHLVNNLSPGERNISMVFQNYALYPHMTVRENIIFGLKMKKIQAEVIKQRLEKVAYMLGLEHLLERLPRELSGGQQQRVAVARAVVKEAPLFLLDEPLSNIDAQQRTRARVELVNIHKKVGSTMIYVTHDQTEAMAIGQKIAVFSDGKLHQIGSPWEIYHRPANLFVAKFIGNPPMNLIQIKVIGREISFADADVTLNLPSEVQSKIDWDTFSNAKTLGIRPEDICLYKGEQRNHEVISAKLFMREDLGSESIFYFKIGENLELISKWKLKDKISNDEILNLKFNWENVIFFDECGCLINNAIKNDKIFV